MTRPRWQVPDAIRRAGVLVTAVILAGCPIPLPAGYFPDSRENVPAQRPDWIAAGTTTREEVLLKLGEADGAAGDGSWLAYGSAYSKGGVLFVVAAGNAAGGVGGERVEYRRILISFDGDGRVADVEYITRDCWEAVAGVNSSGGRTPPCLKADASD